MGRWTDQHRVEETGKAEPRLPSACYTLFLAIGHALAALYHCYVLHDRVLS